MTAREKFLGITVRTRQAIEVPEIGETVYAHTITALDQIQLAEMNKTYPNAPGSVLLVIAGIRDGDGQPVFADVDVPTLSGLPAALITRLAKAVSDQGQSENIAGNS